LSSFAVRRIKSSLLVCAVLLGVVVSAVFVPAPAYASPGGGSSVPTPTKGTSHLSPGHKWKSGAAAPSRNGVTPALDEGCYTHAYVPSKWGSTITASADIDCISLEPYLRIDTYLQWSRWWGWQTVASNSGSRAPAVYLDIDAGWGCGGSGTHNFQTLAYVYADFWDGSYDDDWLNNGAPRYSC
jgi:hypothetical protein